MSDTATLCANLPSVRTNTGIPSNSANCLVAEALALLERVAEDILVPSPAAGMMTNTFIVGDQYIRADPYVMNQVQPTIRQQATNSHYSWRLEAFVEHRRSWISLLGFCLATAFAAAVIFAVIVAGASVALASHQSATGDAGTDDSRPAAPLTEARPAATTFAGMITDSHCGARHMRNSRQNAAECVRACFRRGASYVLVDGDKRYTLVGGEGTLDKLAGERANVTGTRQGNTILVDSAAALF